MKIFIFEPSQAPKGKKGLLDQLESPIFEKMFQMHLGGQNECLMTPQVLPIALGPISDLQNEFGVILRKIKIILTFSKMFAWFSSMFYAYILQKMNMILTF